MLHMKKSLSKMAVLALTVSMLAAGCNNAGNDPVNNSSAGNATNEVEATEQPTVNPATEEPVATKAPAGEAATSEPAATEEPAADAATSEPAATEQPNTADEPQVKPANPPGRPSGGKPAQPAAPKEKPAATAKPTQKPTQKPAQKPSATPKPTVKPAEVVNVSDISDKIIADMEMPRMIPAEGELVKDMYGIDASALLSDGIFLQAMMNTKATELVIVKLKSDKNYDAVVEGLEVRAAQIQKTFETYLQDQYEDAKNYKIVRKGDYVMLSISHDQDKVLEIFNGFFK
ncbi:cell wall-associated NlpC family hydrolase [Paenibacillus endophyticus]|uniref:Cell wall-associated NlpC family hydrolase n=1 Tax=Paenibacillus endophyticus TaxID=1294268 RepID=A0A7W5GEM3_9BACL|nr:DUF4358 domain-containing protein [Paenibacillus endophyticus]MBB3156267.1 cell wall-associated NlpC family hydrolase [Paenibacillus endophyticus]